MTGEMSWRISLAELSIASRVRSRSLDRCNGSGRIKLGLLIFCTLIDERSIVSFTSMITSRNDAIASSSQCVFRFKISISLFTDIMEESFKIKSLIKLGEFIEDVNDDCILLICKSIYFLEHRSILSTFFCNSSKCSVLAIVADVKMDILSFEDLNSELNRFTEFSRPNDIPLIFSTLIFINSEYSVTLDFHPRSVVLGCEGGGGGGGVLFKDLLIRSLISDTLLLKLNLGSSCSLLNSEFMTSGFIGDSKVSPISLQPRGGTL